MAVTNAEEYETPQGQIVSIQQNGDTWEVACWNADDTTHWYKEYRNGAEARTEYERWRPTPLTAPTASPS